MSCLLKRRNSFFFILKTKILLSFYKHLEEFNSYPLIFQASSHPYFHWYSSTQLCCPNSGPETVSIPRTLHVSSFTGLSTQTLLILQIKDLIRLRIKANCYITMEFGTWEWDSIHKSSAHYQTLRYKEIN